MTSSVTSARLLPNQNFSETTAFKMEALLDMQNKYPWLAPWAKEELRELELSLRVGHSKQPPQAPFSVDSTNPLLTNQTDASNNQTTDNSSKKERRKLLIFKIIKLRNLLKNEKSSLTPREKEQLEKQLKELEPSLRVEHSKQPPQAPFSVDSTNPLPTNQADSVNNQSTGNPSRGKNRKRDLMDEIIRVKKICNRKSLHAPWAKEKLRELECSLREEHSKQPPRYRWDPYARSPVAVKKIQ